jgi:hypothetical protein
MPKKTAGMWTPTDADLLRALAKRGTAMAQTLLGDLNVPRSRWHKIKTERITAQRGPMEVTASLLTEKQEDNPIWAPGAAGKRMAALVKAGHAEKHYQSYTITAAGRESIGQTADGSAA